MLENMLPALFIYVLFLAISVSGTDDVRPVLDYYKQQGDNILDTFKGAVALNFAITNFDTHTKYILCHKILFSLP